MGIKKLYNDMSDVEAKLLREVVDKTRICKFPDHIRQRMKEKDISKEDINFVFNNYEIVEFHYNNDNPRVLLRGKTKDYKGRCTCISLNLDDRKVITAYKNYDTDKHNTLDYSNYILKNVDITNMLKNIKRSLNN